MNFFKLLVLSQFIFSSVLARAAEQKVQGKTKTDFVQSQTLIAGKYRISLHNLNPYINKWFILELKGKKHFKFHLENRTPESLLSLNDQGISLKTALLPTHSRSCLLWDNEEFDLRRVNFTKYKKTYYPLCNGLLFIRLEKSSNTRLSVTEWATEILRQTKFGEDIISAIKPYMVKWDAESGQGTVAAEASAEFEINPGKPLKPMIARDGKRNLISLENQLGFEINNKKDHLRFGKWYETKMHDGIYTAIFMPNLIDKAVFKTYKSRVNRLGEEELNKLVYMTAYDLNRYTVNYSVGTEHPAINTSPAVYGKNAALREVLVPVGSIPPYELRNAVGVFIGGFKNRHGKFRRGPHRGKTYGYIQNGVELAPMSGGLATLYVKKDGSLNIGEWPVAASEQMALRRGVVSARQNGVLIMKDGAPGQYVNNWRAGNWSADVNGLGRSLRSGVCLQERDHKKFLIFMAFTSATPSSMARVMQAYHCRAAMHLDMNAYMYMHNAIYTWVDEKGFDVQYLNKAMLYPKGLKHHRFIMDNNNRDFFYVKKRFSARPLVVENH